MGKERATHVDADGLQLVFGARDDVDGLGAPVPEQCLQCGAHELDIGIGDTERGGRKSDLFDEEADLVDVEVHEAVHFVDAGETAVGGIAWLADLGATEQDAEVGVQMREQLAGKSQKGNR